MNLLSIECSCVPVSAAVICNGEIKGFSFSDIKLTHSQTLFPAIKSALESAKLGFSDIDAVGVATGPGSFTGLRIGISSAKGLAEPENLKCVGVSTLLSAAYMFLDENAVICPVIDARCGQVYNALFKVSRGKVTRLCDDRAVMANDLISELKNITEDKIILCCDAAENVIKLLDNQSNVVLAPKPLIFQNAKGVGLCANELINSGDFVEPAMLKPTYLKLPQAQRELKEKQKEG